MEYFLTFDDRKALFERAVEDTGLSESMDYYGQLIEFALMHPERLEEIKTGRNKDFEGEAVKQDKPIKPFLRFVK